jgi:hypothetical protein
LGYPPQGTGGALRPQRWESIISDQVLAHDPNTYSEFATAWTEKKRVRINFSGKIRTTFELWTRDGASAQEARIFRNGVAYSDVASTLSTSPVSFTLDTGGWLPGDVYSFRTHAVNYGYTGYMRNWRLCGTIFSLFDSAPFNIEL